MINSCNLRHVKVKSIITAFLVFQINLVVLPQGRIDSGLEGKWLDVTGTSCHDSINSIQFFSDSTILQLNWQSFGPFDLLAKRAVISIINDKGDLFLHMINEEMQWGTESEFSSQNNLNSNSPPKSKYMLLPDSSGFCLIGLKTIRTGLEYEWTIPRCYSSNLTLLSDDSPKKSQGLFLIPSGYTGRIMVALNQESGQEAVFDDRNRRVLVIPGNGLLKTKAKPMPEAFAKNQFDYYYQNENGVMIELKQIPNTCLNSLIGLSEKEIKKLGYNPDEVYVLPARYNPARNIINKHFEEEITGQVKLIIVDVLKNLIPKLDD